MADEPRPEHLGPQHRGGDRAAEPGVVPGASAWDYHLLLWFCVAPFFVLFVLFGL